MHATILNNTPGNPAPDNAETGFFKTYDGKRIRYAIFRSGQVGTAGTVVLLQGRNETIEKYYETIRNLNDTGLSVATFDWRGQGGSERLHSNPMLGYVRRFSDYERDLEQFLDAFVLPDTRPPFFLIGHSTGALVALSAAPRLNNRIERMALTSPFIGLMHDRFGQPAIRIASKIACLIGLGHIAPSGSRRANLDFADNALTGDPVRFRRNLAIYDVCPQFILGGPTFRWLSQALDTIATVHRPRHLAAIRIPTLLLGAAADRIVPHHLLEELASRFGASGLITVDHAQHELLQESDIYRNQVMAAINAFIQSDRS